MKDIKSLTFEELKEEISLMGEKGFRAGQIYSWMHEKLVTSFDDKCYIYWPNNNSF